MAISLIGTPQISGGIDGANRTLTFSTAPLQDDVTLLGGGHGLNNTIGPSTAGYTAFPSPNPLIGSDPRLGWWFKVQGGTPDTNVIALGGADSQSAVVYCAYVLRGVDLTNVSDATPTNNSGAGGTAPNGLAITTATDGAWVFVIEGHNNNGLAGTVPSGYTNQVSNGQTDTNRFAIAAALKLVAVAGVEDPGAWGSTVSAAWKTLTIAIRPAVTTAGSPRPVRMAGERAAMSRHFRW